MKMTTYRLQLPLEHEFTISRESISIQPSLIVELEHDGYRGFGEVTEDQYYGHTFDSMASSLEKARGLLNEYLDQTPQQLWSRMQDATDGDMFALSALDMAAHDLRGKRLGIPTWKDWGLSWQNVPESSYTIGIDSIDKMVEKLTEMAGWSIYKIKLGTAYDLEIVTELRRHTRALLRVDANCAWTTDQTIAYSHVLAELGVEFIEQPLAVDASREDKFRVFQGSCLPIIADEDCRTQEDVPHCHGLYHGVNVKICKCGGLSPALNMLRNARELGMKTMLGCMIESSVGISGAAQLLPLLDYADLDGAVLLRNDPASGVTIQRGAIRMSELAGCGSTLNDDRLSSFLFHEQTQQ